MDGLALAIFLAVCSGPLSDKTVYPYGSPEFQEQVACYEYILDASYGPNATEMEHP